MAAPADRVIRAAALALAILSGTGLAGQQAFPHEAHDALFPLCAGCHAIDRGPGALYPPADLCARCHDGEQAPGVDWTPPTAGEAYGHPGHGVGSAVPLECEACHGPDGAARVADVGERCEACHVEHHGETARCRICHAPSPRSAHTRRAHAGCAGSGCHEAEGVEGLVFNRPLCLLCHREMSDHEPGRYCGDCHAVKQPAG